MVAIIIIILIRIDVGNEALKRRG